MSVSTVIVRPVVVATAVVRLPVQTVVVMRTVEAVRVVGSANAGPAGPPGDGRVFLDLTDTPITGDITDWDPGVANDAVILVTNLATRVTHPYPVWQPNTFYDNGVYVPSVLNGHGYQVVLAGTSGPTEPAWVTDSTSFAEGPDSLVWQDLGAGSDTQPAPNVIHGIVAGAPNQVLTVLCSLDSVGSLAWDVNKENPSGGWTTSRGNGVTHMRVKDRWWVAHFVGYEDPSVD